jgi:replicative DNA helicase
VNSFENFIENEKQRKISIAIELLGNLFKYQSQWKKYKTFLVPDHFMDYSYIFTAMQRAEKRDGELNFKSVLKDLGAEHIPAMTAIKDAVISEGRTEHLVDVLRKERTKKEIILIAERLKMSITDYDPTDLVNRLREHLEDMTVRDTPVHIDPKENYEQFLDTLIAGKANPKDFEGLLVGLVDLDAITSGWQKQDLIVIGGRTSMGKSAFALANVIALAQKGYKCLYMSLEMSKRQVYARLAASAYGIPLKAFKVGAITDDSIARLEQRDPFWLNIFVDDTRAVTADYIADRMMEIKNHHGLDFVVVDYLQDIKEAGEQFDNQGSSLARICRKLRKAAQDADCPVMAMSQIVRDVEKRNDKRPNNSDLSGSTGIETSADLIGILYRDEYYNSDTKEPNVIELIITKHRNGSLGLVKFYYDKSTQQIKLLSEVGFTSDRKPTASGKKDHRRSDD